MPGWQRMAGKLWAPTAFGIFLGIFFAAAAAAAAAAAGAQAAQANQTATPNIPAGPNVQNSTTELRVGSQLVLVPTLVATKRGEPVFTLTAADFAVTDDGVPQKLRLEPDAGSTPLALVVVVETGGAGAAQLENYRGLGLLVENIVGAVPHRVAVVGFDSKPKLMQSFTGNLDEVGDALDALRPGDKGAAIFDALGMAITMLGKQPPSYRRQILLLSETRDQGSERDVEQALQTISDTNTTIYSLAFPSIGSTARHQTLKIYYDPDPEPPGGCMSRKPNADGSPQKSVAAQAYDCAGVLLPPLRLAKILETAARNEMRQNVPRTVAEVSGGEYFKFKNVRSLQRDLIAISNHMPNRYLLSFQPQSPHVGMHAITVKLPDYPQLKVAGRRGYWVDAQDGSGK